MKKNNKSAKKPNLSFKIIKEKALEAKGKAVIILTLAIFALNIAIFIPMPTLAQIKNFDYFAKALEAEGSIDLMNPFKEKEKINNKLPKSRDLEAISSRNVLFTAYNSEVAQCDSSPCITANGFNVCKHGVEDTVAMNGIPMGTKIRIPELFGDRVFVVRDRMNARYGADRGDIWMLEKSAAVEFGVKLAKIEILK